MRITIPTLAAAISLAVFACSESPSAPPTEDSSSSGETASSSSDGTGSSSSSSEIPSSSSSAPDIIGGRACQYSGEEIGISGLFLCAEAQSEPANWQEYKTECQEDGGTWVNACPGGEKTICIAGEDDEEEDGEEEDDEEILFKLYADGFNCSDVRLKNADGSTDLIFKGGACGPFKPADDVPLSMCTEFPELSTGIIKLSCVRLEAPFANKCPDNVDLACYDPEKEIISYLYGESIMLPFTCEDLDMEEL